MAFPLLGGLTVVRNLGVGALLLLNLYNEFNEALENLDNGEPVSEPPEFNGGQCAGNAYTIIAAAEYNGVTRYFPRNLASGGTDLEGLIGFGNTQPPFIGKINGFSLSEDSQTFFMDIDAAIGGRIDIAKSIFGTGEADRDSIRIFRVINRTNSLDPCGNLTNEVGNNNNGLFGNGFTGSALTSLAAGAAAAAALAAAAAAKAAAAAATAAALGSVAAAKAALAAAAAAAGSATTLGGLAGALGTALTALLDLLDLFRELDRREKEEKEKEEEEKEVKEKIKSFATSNFGTRSRDGFLALYPEGRNDIKAIQFNTILRDVPQGFGRFFGQNSPNRFIYQRLGYIAFTASNLGVIEVVDLEFPRHAIPIPEEAIGCFFHFGLIGNVKIEIEVLYEVFE